MPNWSADFLEQNPDLSQYAAARHRHGLTFALPGRDKQSVFVGSPAHWWDAANGWQQINTRLVWDAGSNTWGAAGVPVRFTVDGHAFNVGGSHVQRTTRVGLFRPSNRTFYGVRDMPAPLPSGASLVRESGIWRFETTLLEHGVREELTIQERPSVAGVQAGDYLVLETAVEGSAFADGWLDEFEVDGFRFSLPHCQDAAADFAPTKRYARTVSGVQYVYTGVPVSWLADAVYPVVLDPDYAASTADGHVYGQNADYATARSTSSGYDSATNYVQIGQSEVTGTDTVWRAYLKFDTSAIPDGDVISQVNLKLVCVNDFSDADFDVQIVKQDWSGQDALAAGNREAAYDNCLAGTADDNIWRNTSGISTNTVYTSGNLATGWPSKTGNTYYSLRSSEDYDNSAPSGSESIRIASQDNATSGYRPLLAITHAAPVTANFMHSYRRRRT